MEALLLIDIQNDFLPGGALPVPQGDQVVPVALRLLDRFPLCVASKDWHPPDHVSFAASHPGHEVGEVIQTPHGPQVLWPVHCVQESWGAEFAPGLAEAAGRIDHVVYKGTDSAIDSYSAFFDNGHLRSTGLEDYLRNRQVDTLYVLGLATDYCVRWSAEDALRLGFKVWIVQDGCRAVEPDKQQVVFEELCRQGARLTTSKELVDFESPQSSQAGPSR